MTTMTSSRWLSFLMSILVYVQTVAAARSSATETPAREPGIVADEVHIEYHPGSSLAGTAGAAAAFGDWNRDWSVLSGTVGGRLNQARCVDIPANLSLCRGIGYNQMRLPNLLDHDSVTEATQQAASWVPLLNIRCHSDTQMFLCSLFAPVCLDRPIWPCRTLCTAVQQGCESRMIKYGFPWPEMLRCDKFPLDNDLCIGLQANKTQEDKTCPPCDQPDTFESVVDNYCSSEFVLRIKPSEVLVSGSDLKIITSKKKVFKHDGLEKRHLRGESIFFIENGASCQCNNMETDGTVSSSRPQRVSAPTAADSRFGWYLVMGKRKVPGDRLVLTFVHSMQRRSPGVTRALNSVRRKTTCNGAALDAVVPGGPYGVASSAATPATVGRGAGSDVKNENKNANRKGSKKTTPTPSPTVAATTTPAGKRSSGKGKKPGADDAERSKKERGKNSGDKRQQLGDGNGKKRSGKAKRRRSETSPVP